MSKKTSVLYVVLIVSFLFPVVASAQYFFGLDTVWMRRYNGPQDSTDHPIGMKLDDSGNVYVTGYTCTRATGADFVLIKYDQTGVQKWVSNYNTPESLDDYCNAMAMDKDGNIYLTGTTQKVPAKIKGDFLTVKFNKDGAVEWAKKYNGTANDDDFAWSVAVDTKGNILVGGMATNFGTDRDMAVIKYSPKGDVMWTASYDGHSYRTNEFYAMTVDNKDNIYVGGSCYNPKTYDDFALVKFNASGKKEWVKTYSYPMAGDEMVKALATDKSGNIYVAGVSSYTFVTIKYNPSGKELWLKRYADTEHSDEPKLITVDDSSNVCVAGTSHGMNFLDDWLVVKYDTKGNEMWHYVYDGLEGGTDLPNAMTYDKASNIYVTGGTYTKSQGPNFLTIQFDSRTGNPDRLAKYDGYLFDEPKAIALDKDGNVYVTGISESFLTDQDILTIKYFPK